MELIDALWRKVETARGTPSADKFLAGPDLFDDLVRWILAGIRNQFPGATEAEIARQVDRRLAIGERLENH